jgi:CheY-like chemotaxis protein
MTSFRVLLVDDEPDIRDVVEISLGLDPLIAVRSCASGREALRVAAEWMPDVMLCDVTMPDMDGPATLAALRKCRRTENVPVIFITARAQSQELDYFKSLGAAGVISKPFDPMTLSADVRGHIRAVRMSALSNDFTQRLHTDSVALNRLRSKLVDGEPDQRAVIEAIKAIAHALAGAAGIYGHDGIGNKAAMLEAAASKRLRGENELWVVEHELASLLSCVAKL